ncbi:hypothetical protein [Rubrobacter naiadicus]|uniref:hypothetical protein n=1 Tax=Rubrobacter naiadicus TaxID=1392641 RepID=UPI002361508E|nr:hypothetical protein [Rubrobacter naiadicus]
MLEIGITLIVVLMASVRGSMRQRLVWPRKFFVAMIGSATTVVVIISTFVIFAPWILQRWLQRSQGNVGFATFWTRVAAVFGQWEQLVHNPIGWITGQGFGHVYQYSQAFAVYVYPYVSWSSFSQTMWYPGEFMWVTPLYYAGFVAGSIAILVLLYGFLCAFRTLVALTMGSRNTNLWWPLWVGSLGYLSTLTLGFTSDPFGSRLAGMFLGLSLGLVIVLRNNKNIAQKYQNTGTSGRSAIDKSTAYIK